MQWTPDMLRAMGVGEQGVQQVFSQTAPVPKSGPFSNYSPYTQTGSAIGVPPSTQAVVPRTPTMPVIRTTGGLPITDAQYKPVGPQRQIGYTPKFTQGSATGMSTGGAAYNPYGGKMYQGGKGFGKPAPLLGKVAKAGIGGGVGAVLTDMLFPDSANQIDDVARIRNYKPLQSHGMTTPQAAGFPALQPMPNQAEFEKEFRKSEEMKSSDYGKVPNTGYMEWVDDRGKKQRREVLNTQEGLGGYGRPSTADANLAREEAEYQQSREISARRAALDAQELQQSLAQRAKSAIASGDYQQAAALGQMLQQAGGLQVDDYGTQQLAQAQAKITPQAQQQKGALEAAQAEQARGMGAYYAARPGIESFQSRIQAVLKKLEMSRPDPKMVGAHLSMIEALPAEERAAALQTFKQKYGFQ